MTTVKFDLAAVGGKIKNEARGATAAFSAKVLEDCNRYCRELTGALIRSSKRASDLRGGYLVWDTPYAKRVYYTGEARTGVNADASKLWGEKAKSVHLEEWKEVARDAME